MSPAEAFVCVVGAAVGYGRSDVEDLPRHREMGSIGQDRSAI